MKDCGLLVGVHFAMQRSKYCSQRNQSLEARKIAHSIVP